MKHLENFVDIFQLIEIRYSFSFVIPSSRYLVSGVGSDSTGMLAPCSARSSIELTLYIVAFEYKLRSRQVSHHNNQFTKALNQAQIL